MTRYFYTYVLRSKVDNLLYIGCTDNLDKRLLEHNSGKVIATKTRIPLELVYFEACLNRKNAYKREKVLKTGFGRQYLKSRL